MAVIGDRIEAARAAAGISKRRLAARLEVSPATLKRWTEGTVSPRYADLQAIAAVCGVSMSWLTSIHDSNDPQLNGSPAGGEPPEAAQ